MQRSIFRDWRQRNMFKHYKRILKGESAIPRQESASRPIEPAERHQTEPRSTSAGVPPTEAAVAAANANRAHSGSVLASKIQAEQRLSPRIAASPVPAVPQQASPEIVPVSPAPVPSTAVLCAETEAPPPSASAAITPQSEPSHRHHPLDHKQQPAPTGDAPRQSSASPHVEESAPSYTSSTGSSSKPRSPLKDHKAALHAANERLKKALQQGSKHPTDTAGAAHAQRPAGTGTAPASVNTSMPVPKDPALQSSVAVVANHSKQQQTNANSSTVSRPLPHLASEASVMSAESDDDLNDLTGKFPCLPLCSTC